MQLTPLQRAGSRRPAGSDAQLAERTQSDLAAVQALVHDAASDSSDDGEGEG